MERLTNLGWSQPQAIGILANLRAESQLNSWAENGSGHYGIAQWDKNRQADFAQWAGFDIHQPEATLQKQLEFLNYELRHGKEQVAGKLLLAAKNAERAGYVTAHYYERVGKPFEEARRSAEAGSISQQITIHVNGSGDPELSAITIKKHLKYIIRDAQGAVQ
jgi:hypothetical protein